MDRPIGGGVLDGIGNTPLVELRRVVPPGSARIVAKLESANPTGSMKDRMARALVERAAAAGRLPPGGTVVEHTAGTTGISLAFVCAALGHRPTSSSPTRSATRSGGPCGPTAPRSPTSRARPSGSTRGWSGA